MAFIILRTVQELVYHAYGNNHIPCYGVQRLAIVGNGSESGRDQAPYAYGQGDTGKEACSARIRLYGDLTSMLLISNGLYDGRLLNPSFGYNSLRGISC